MSRSNLSKCACRTYNTPDKVFPILYIRYLYCIILYLFSVIVRCIILRGMYNYVSLVG